MKRQIALLLVLVMSLSLVACGGPAPGSTPDKSAPSKPAESVKPSEPNQPADPDADKYGGDLVVAYGNSVAHLDPHQQTASQLGIKGVTLHVWEGLGIYDYNGKAYGQVCDIEESADGCTVKFTLRERYFSNGEKIEMEDVLASLHRSVALLSSGDYDENWKNTTMTVEGNTITFSMDSYNLMFMNSLCSVAGFYQIMPKEICEKYAFTGGEVQPNGFTKGASAPVISRVEDCIGSGPYAITKYTDTEVAFARNDKYAAIENEGAVGVAKAAKCYMDTITFSINTDSASRNAAMLANEYHIGAVSDDVREAAKAAGIIFGDPGTTWTHGIFFNLHESNADSPVYNVNFRKAVRACLDITAVMLSVREAGGDINRIHLDPYVVVKDNVAYASTKMEDSGEWNVADQELAKEYLKKADYKGEEIVYLCHASGDFYNAAMVVIPQLEAIGINVKLMVVDNASHSAMRKDYKTGHDIGGWNSQKRTDNPVLQATYVTGSTGWWNSPAKEAAISIMQTTPTGSPESVKAYNDYLDAVIDECPYIIFGHPTGVASWQNYVEPNTYGDIRYYYWNTYFTDKDKA